MNNVLKSFARVAGAILALGVSLGAQTPQVMEIPLDGVIHPISAEYVTSGI